MAEIKHAIGAWLCRRGFHKWRKIMATIQTTVANYNKAVLELSKKEVING